MGGWVELGRGGSAFPQSRDSGLVSPVESPAVNPPAWQCTDRADRAFAFQQVGPQEAAWARQSPKNHIKSPKDGGLKDLAVYCKLRRVGPRWTGPVVCDLMRSPALPATGRILWGLHMS